MSIAEEAREPMSLLLWPLAERAFQTGFGAPATGGPPPVGTHAGPRRHTSA